MSVRFYRVPDLYPDVPYAYAASTQENNSTVLFTAGACPLDGDGVVVHPGDISAQTRQVLHNLRVTLNACGVDIENVIKTTIYVVAKKREDLLEAWEEVETVFENHDVPSTLLGVAVLGWPNQLVEIEAVAVRPQS